MISIDDFNKSFIARHDFEYDDLDFLPLKYPGIGFLNIPEAWVVLIDTFLMKIHEREKIKSISNVMGFLIVDGNVSKTDQLFLKWLESKVIELDIDLHERLGEGIVLH